MAKHIELKGISLYSGDIVNIKNKEGIYWGKNKQDVVSCNSKNSGYATNFVLEILEDNSFWRRKKRRS
jgi:hypothetical protein